CTASWWLRAIRSTTVEAERLARLSSLPQPSCRGDPTLGRLNPDRERCAERPGALDERLDAQVLDATRLELGHVRLARPQKPRQLFLGQPSGLTKRNDLLLQFHLGHEIVDCLGEPRVRRQLVVDPPHEGCLLHRFVPCPPRAATRRITSAKV